MAFPQDEAFRYANQRTVFRTIRHAGSTTRRQLTQQTDLSFQTVSNIVSELFDMNLVVSDGLVNQSAGKRAESIKINPRGLYAVGILLDRTGFELNLIDLEGNSLAHTAESSSSIHPDTVLRHIATLTQEFLKQADVPLSRFAGLGIASPGPIDFRYGAISHPPNFPGWAFVPVQQRLNELMNCPVTLIKDSHAAALAEVWALNAEAPSSLFYLYFSAGIGGALVIDNRIWTGFLGNAGEIGHVKVAQEPACDCGRQGCLESVWSLGRAASNANLSVEQFAQLLQTKTSPHWDQWKPGLRFLAQATVDIVNVMEPEVVIIGGPQGEAISGHVIPTLNSALQQGGFVRHLRPISVQNAVVRPAASIGAGLLQINASLTTSTRSSGQVGLDI